VAEAAACEDADGGGPWSCTLTVLRQSMHLQFSEHITAAWKHSQYFFRHPLFLQWQPFMCRPAESGESLPPLPPPLSADVASTLGRKARGFRSSVAPMADWRSISNRGLLWHEWQLHCPAELVGKTEKAPTPRTRHAQTRHTQDTRACQSTVRVSIHPFTNEYIRTGLGIVCACVLAADTCEVALSQEQIAGRFGHEYPISTSLSPTRTKTALYTHKLKFKATNAECTLEPHLHSKLLQQNTRSRASSTGSSYSYMAFCVAVPRGPASLQGLSPHVCLRCSTATQRPCPSQQQPHASSLPATQPPHACTLTSRRACPPPARRPHACRRRST